MQEDNISMQEDTNGVNFIPNLLLLNGPTIEFYQQTTKLSSDNFSKTNILLSHHRKELSTRLNLFHPKTEKVEPACTKKIKTKEQLHMVRIALLDGHTIDGHTIFIQLKSCNHLIQPIYIVNIQFSL